MILGNYVGLVNNIIYWKVILNLFSVFWFILREESWCGVVWDRCSFGLIRSIIVEFVWKLMKCVVWNCYELLVLGYWYNFWMEIVWLLVLKLVEFCLDRKFKLNF